MRIKNLVLVNTRLIVDEYRKDNFNTIVMSMPNGYKILEKKYVKTDYSIMKQKKYYIPGTDIAIDQYWGQKKGEVYKKGLALPLCLFSRKKDLNESDIKVLEKKFNKKGQKNEN